MSRVDQKYGGFQGGSHWSERWGEDSHNYWECTKEEHLERQKDSPQPNPSTPIKSMSCQPDTLDISSLILATEWNFLTFAASHGLLRYLRHILESNTTMPTEDAVIYLLHLSVLSIPRNSEAVDTNRILAALHLAQELISCDVDLNLEVSRDSTLWSMFLVRMSRMLLSSWSGTVYHGSKDEVLALQTEFAKTMIALIANGSELEQTIFITLNAMVFSSPYITYHYRFGLSVWAVAELCLKGRSELSEIRQAYIHAGTPYYARCFSIGVASERASNPGKL